MWLKSLVSAKIVAGFKKCGVYPYDSNAIAIPSEAKRKPQPKIDITLSVQSLRLLKIAGIMRTKHGASEGCESDEDGN